MTSASISGILLQVYLVYLCRYIWYTSAGISGIPLQIYLVYFCRYIWYTSAGTSGILLQVHLVYFCRYIWYTTLTVHPSATASPFISVVDTGSQLHISGGIHSNIFWVFISLYTWKSVRLTDSHFPSLHILHMFIFLFYKDLSRIKVSISLFLL